MLEKVIQKAGLLLLQAPWAAAQ